MCWDGYRAWLIGSIVTVVKLYGYCLAGVNSLRFMTLGVQSYYYVYCLL